MGPGHRRRRCIGPAKRMEAAPSVVAGAYQRAGVPGHLSPTSVGRIVEVPGGPFEAIAFLLDQVQLRFQTEYRAPRLANLRGVSLRLSGSGARGPVAESADKANRQLHD